MTNKLVNQGTYYKSWHGFNKAGEYVGRIEKDEQDCWWLVSNKGDRALMSSYSEARTELQYHSKRK